MMYGGRIYNALSNMANGFQDLSSGSVVGESIIEIQNPKSQAMFKFKTRTRIFFIETNL